MDIKKQVEKAVREVIENSFLEAGDIFVIGCSTSEIVDKKIGSGSVPDLGRQVYEGARTVLDEYDLELAAQSCEHLNRALVVEKKVAKEKGLTIVSAVPKPDAGGSFATASYENMKDPVLVEEVKARAAIDIGDTLIGMHLDRVAVPLRLSLDKIGEAHLTAAFVRPKLIGGARAKYK